MLNVYDIVLNLLDSARVYDSFEWNKKDNIEHIKKIPMVKLSSNNLNNMIETTFVIDKSFLNEIYRKTEIYNDDGSTYIDYASLFTDGFRVVAIEFDKDGKSLFKSFMLLDEEEEVLEISNEIKTREIDYKILRRYKNNSYLTREEEYKRNYLIKEIKNSYRKKEYEKINYLYGEIFNDSKKDINYKFNYLIDDITNNYSDIHINLYKILKLSKKEKTTNQ